MIQDKVGRKILIRGIVQGVGFRPTVFKYATNLNLSGWVRNTAQGVEIQVTGDCRPIEKFVSQLKLNPPPLAKIDSFTVEDIPPAPDRDFHIIESVPSDEDFLPISPDLNICPDCLRELFDPEDRRYRYPFINCTNCGPRFTIIKDIPYDRSKTTMSSFQMCPTCKAEYLNPKNRRFHAQPVACPECGPQVWFEVQGQVLCRAEDAILKTRNYLQTGKIVALKSLGGYQLACDASNEEAVQTLRIRKHRSQKPFALMADSLETIRQFCNPSPEEIELLTSPASPIVLMQSKPNVDLPSGLAPRQNSLGFMLPYTPLHHLLIEKADGYPQLLVMTSGNLSEEPIAFSDGDARQRLSSLADGFLMHDRVINIRTDDSVMRVIASHVYPIRRARGYAPSPINLPFSTRPMLAVGGELKNTIAISRENYAFLSQFIGDLENLETTNSFESTIDHFETLFRVKPEVVVCDLHPDYRSTVFAQELSCSARIPLIQVQHHHAHFASCLADSGWDTLEPAIGVCFDGTGYGTDGTIWGGEFFFGGYTSFERRYHLSFTPLPGGEASIAKPARSALAHLWKAGLDWDADLPPIRFTSQQEIELIRIQLEKGINSPMTSSMGRVFDAVSSLLGICQVSSYEGQAAMELEATVDPSEQGSYPYEITNSEINLSSLFGAIIQDLMKDRSVSSISAKFHHSIVNIVVEVCHMLLANTGCRTVALSGGVWQNIYLLSNALKSLSREGFTVLTHRQVPPNDGGISVGQLMIAAVQMEKG